LYDGWRVGAAGRASVHAPEHPPFRGYFDCQRLAFRRGDVTSRGASDDGSDGSPPGSLGADTNISLNLLSLFHSAVALLIRR